MKYDLEAIQKRMDKAKPDYKEDKAKVRREQAEHTQGTKRCHCFSNEGNVRSGDLQPNRKTSKKGLL